MEIEVMLHCGNAPKMEQVIDLTVALFKMDINVINTMVTKDFVWNKVGKSKGLSLNDLASGSSHVKKVSKLTIINALSHGNKAMCEGTLVLEDKQVFHFCNVVRFTSTVKSALIKASHCYFIKSNG